MKLNSKTIFEGLISVFVNKNQYLTRDTGVLLAGRQVRMGISPGGFPALVVPVALAREGKINLNLQSIWADFFNGDGNELELGSFLRLELRDLKLIREFSFLVDDVLDSLVTAVELPQANRILDVVNSWKNLFSELLTPNVDKHKLIGAYGELLFLESLVEQYGPDSLNSWQGYETERHDFISPKAAIEIKTTLSRERFDVTIHGLFQLDADLLGILGIKLEKSPRGRSLLELIDSITLLGVPNHEIAKRLMRIGINIAEGGDIDSQKYIVFESKYCLVDDNFPKIVPSTLNTTTNANLIGNLVYRVNIAPLSGVAGHSAFNEAATLLGAHFEA